MKKSTIIKGLSIFIILFVVINYLTINIVPAEQLELSESKTTGKINNIVVFLKFADDEDAYNNKYDEIKEVFNKKNGNSLKHYIKTMSNNKLTVDSTFYPLDDMFMPMKLIIMLLIMKKLVKIILMAILILMEVKEKGSY